MGRGNKHILNTIADSRKKSQPNSIKIKCHIMHRAVIENCNLYNLLRLSVLDFPLVLQVILGYSIPRMDGVIF